MHATIVNVTPSPSQRLCHSTHGTLATFTPQYMACLQQHLLSIAMVHLKQRLLLSTNGTPATTFTLYQ